MIDQGDIATADLNLERRLRVVVLSTRQFHRLTERALAAPRELPEPFPWRIVHGEDTFAIDLMRTVAVDRLGQPEGRLSLVALRHATQAVRLIAA